MMGEPTSTAESLAKASAELDAALENLQKSSNNLVDNSNSFLTASNNLAPSIGVGTLTGVATSGPIGGIWAAANPGPPINTSGYVQFNNSGNMSWEGDTSVHNTPMYVRFQNEGDFGGKVSLYINHKEVLILDHRGRVTINSEEPMDKLVKSFTDCLGTSWEEWLNKSVDLWGINEAALKSRRAAFEEALEICTNEEDRAKIQKKLSETII